MDMGGTVVGKRRTIFADLPENPCRIHRKCADDTSVGKIHAQIWFIGRT